jgi:phage gp36-like protein
MAYATPADMLSRYDARTIGDLVDDTNSQVTPEELATNPVLLTMLADASGDIEAVLSVGGRYLPADLNQLAGNARNFLVRICCDLALAHLMRRRPSLDAEKLKALADLARQHLKELQDGIAIFPSDAAIDASQPELTGPTAVDFRDMNLMRDRTRNYFPRRVLPEGRN